MNHPRIENSDRGFTVNKSGSLWAAGGFILAILGAGWQVSSAFNTVQNDVESLSEQVAGQAAERLQYRRDIEARLRGLELSRAGDDQRLSNALNLLTRIDQRLERLEQRISQ